MVQSSDVPSALILNVKSDWLFENIRAVNALADHGNSMVLLDQRGTILNPDGKQLENTPMKSALDAYFQANTRRNGYYVDASGDTKSMISFITLDNGWRGLAIHPSEIAMGNILQTRNSSYMINAGWLLLSILVSLLVSRKLYQPIERLVNEVH